MADKMMRMAARKSNGTAAPVTIDDNGRIYTNRQWRKTWETINEGMEIRDTSGHDLNAVDVRNVPIFSLRILNRLSKPVKIFFKTDVNTTNGYALTNKDGQDISITVAPSNAYEMITFNDLPELQYMQYVRMSIIAQDTPTSGIFSAYIVKMG